MSSSISAVVINADKNVDFSGYSDGSVNSDNKLQLNMDESVKVFDMNGNSVSADDIKGKNALVLYSEATKSIPAQTTPVLVVDLPLLFSSLFKAVPQEVSKCANQSNQCNFCKLCGSLRAGKSGSDRDELPKCTFESFLYSENSLQFYRCFHCESCLLQSETAGDSV